MGTGLCGGRNLSPLPVGIGLTFLTKLGADQSSYAHTRVPYTGLSPFNLKTYRGTCIQTTRETTMSHYSTATAACATVPCGRSQHQTVQPTTAMLWLLCYEQSRLSTKGSYVARWAAVAAIRVHSTVQWDQRMVR